MEVKTDPSSSDSDSDDANDDDFVLPGNSGLGSDPTLPAYLQRGVSSARTYQAVEPSCDDVYALPCDELWAPRPAQPIEPIAEGPWWGEELDGAPFGMVPDTVGGSSGRVLDGWLAAGMDRRWEAAAVPRPATSSAILAAPDEVSQAKLRTVSAPEGGAWVVRMFHADPALPQLLDTGLGDQPHGGGRGGRRGPKSPQGHLGLNPCELAAVQGALGTLRWLSRHPRFCPSRHLGLGGPSAGRGNRDATFLAASQGHLHVLRWLARVFGGGDLDVGRHDADCGCRTCRSPPHGTPRAVKDAPPRMLRFEQRRSLLEAVQRRGPGGFHPLLAASQNGHLACARWLYRHGARALVGAPGDSGRTALYYARGSGHLELCKWLLLNGGACVEGHPSWARGGAEAGEVVGSAGHVTDSSVRAGLFDDMERSGGVCDDEAIVNDRAVACRRDLVRWAYTAVEDRARFYLYFFQGVYLPIIRHRAAIAASNASHSSNSSKNGRRVEKSRTKRGPSSTLAAAIILGGPRVKREVLEFLGPPCGRALRTLREFVESLDRIHATERTRRTRDADERPVLTALSSLRSQERAPEQSTQEAEMDDFLASTAGIEVFKT